MFSVPNCLAALGLSNILHNMLSAAPELCVRPQ